MVHTVAKIAYRPLRVAWVLRGNSLEDFRHAITWNTCLWGGQRNYIFEEDNLPSSPQLAKDYAVDVVSRIGNFNGSPPRHILELEHSWSLVKPNHQGKNEIKAVDMMSFLPQIVEERKANPDGFSANLCRFDVDKRDDLATLVMCSGCYPDSASSCIDYQKITSEHLQEQIAKISKGNSLPQNYWVTPSFLAMTCWSLKEKHLKHAEQDRIFVFGDATSVSDLISFWNLRASGLKAVFVDVFRWSRFEASLEHLIQKICERIRKGSYGNIFFWRCPSAVDADFVSTKDRVEGLFKRGKVTITLFEIDAKLPNFYNSRYSTTFRDVIGTPHERRGKTSITFPLSSNPVPKNDFFFHQSFCVDVEYQNYDEFRSYPTPFVPELNEFFGRRQLYTENYDRVRATPSGMSVVCRVTDEVLTLTPFEPTTFFLELFKICGFKPSLKKSSHVVLQLFQKLGGLEGFRAFKVEGIRKLIGGFGVDEWVTRGNATRIIDGRHDSDELKAKSLKVYSDFGIDGRDLDSNFLFDSLLAKDLFRAGIEVECPHCHLDAWIYLDDLRTVTKCNYCAQDFRLAPFLKNGSDWKFKKSGLLSRDDNQSGGIPVGLTLHCLNTNLRGSLAVLPYSVGIQLKDAQFDCDIDFVCLHSSRDGVPSLIIGEAKSQGGEIDSKDLRNLVTVARRVEEAIGLPVYVCASKAGIFTADEVIRFKEVKSEFDSLILLSEQELEKYWCYFEMPGQSQELSSAGNPEAFVHNSELLYLSDEKGVDPDSEKLTGNA